MATSPPLLNNAQCRALRRKQTFTEAECAGIRFAKLAVAVAMASAATYGATVTFTHTACMRKAAAEDWCLRSCPLAGDWFVKRKGRRRRQWWVSVRLGCMCSSLHSHGRKSNPNSNPDSSGGKGRLIFAIGSMRGAVCIPVAHRALFAGGML